MIGFLLSGCATFGGGSLRYDNRPLVLQTFSLFNQRTPPNPPARSWRGDWLLRRDRLSMIDSLLRTEKPDIIIMQEALSKRGSPSESDINILSSGSLREYSLDAHQVNAFEDTLEQQYQAVASGLPLVPEKPADHLRRSWRMGEDGYLSMTKITDPDNPPLVIFNIEVPKDKGSERIWFRFVMAKVEMALRDPEVCMERLVLAGYIPGTRVDQWFVKLLGDLSMKDVSAGVCEIESACFTKSPRNEIFRLSSQGETPIQADRILVHESALIQSSGLTLDSPGALPVHHSKYELSKLWPSRRFGWRANIRFARCKT